MWVVISLWSGTYETPLSVNAKIIPVAIEQAVIGKKSKLSTIALVALINNTYINFVY